MLKAAPILFHSGWLVSLVSLLIAVVLYPHAKWLFLFSLIGIALLVLSARFVKDPAPEAVADDIERLMSGTYGEWDVDDFEHLNPRDPEVRKLWLRSMEIGGLPEEWVRLEQRKIDELQQVVYSLRQLSISRKQLS